MADNPQTEVEIANDTGPAAPVSITGATDLTKIGNVGDRLKVDIIDMGKVQVSSNDSTAGNIVDKFVVDTGANTTNSLEGVELNDGGSETYRIRLDESKINHDNLLNYSSAQHIDWSLASQGTIHPSNYVDNNTVYAHPNHTGDVTSVGDGAQTIANNAVTNAKLADVPTQTFKGRITAATGDPEDLTVTQATSLLNLFTSTLKGLVPSSGGGTTNFLRADGTWAAPPGGGGSPWTKSGTTLYPATNGDFVRIGDQNTATAPIDVVSSQAGFLLKLQNLLNNGELIEGINDNGNTIFQVNTNVSSHGIMRVFQDNGEVTLSADTGSVKIGRRTDDVDFNWPLLVMGDTTGGNGFKVMAGENLGDIAFHIADQDDTFQILELEADQGFMTLGKTYAQTLIDNGVVYGVDIQHPGAAKDFNTQNGIYRIAGQPVMLGTYYQNAESDGQSTTTSTTPQTKVTLTTPSLPSGTYRVGWYYEWNGSNTGNDVEIEVLDGATVLARNECAPEDTDAYVGVSGFRYLTAISGVRTITIKYDSQVGGNTSRIRRARLEIWRIS